MLALQHTPHRLDRWSMGVLIRRSRLYGAFSRGMPSPLPALTAPVRRLRRVAALLVQTQCWTSTSRGVAERALGGRTTLDLPLDQAASAGPDLPRSPDCPSRCRRRRYRLKACASKRAPRRSWRCSPRGSGCSRATRARRYRGRLPIAGRQRRARAHRLLRQHPRLPCTGGEEKAFPPGLRRAKED